MKSLRPTVIRVDVYRCQSDLHKNQGLDEGCEPPELRASKAGHWSRCQRPGAGNPVTYD
jgi:hypothetical protein